MGMHVHVGINFYFPLHDYGPLYLSTVSTFSNVHENMEQQ